MQLPLQHRHTTRLRPSLWDSVAGPRPPTVLTTTSTRSNNAHTSPTNEHPLTYGVRRTDGFHRAQCTRHPDSHPRPQCGPGLNKLEMAICSPIPTCLSALNKTPVGIMAFPPPPAVPCPAWATYTYRRSLPVRARCLGCLLCLVRCTRHFSAGILSSVAQNRTW